jgi:IS5 family transposase
LIKLADLVPWDELQDDDTAQFCKGFGAPAKPFQRALGALIVKTRLGLTDEEADYSLSRRHQKHP